MTTQAADNPRRYEAGDVNELPVIAADIIYEGSVVGDNGSGYARPLAAGDPFRGFAEQKVDNSLGSAGDKNVRVRHRGRAQLSVTSLVITDVGKPVYASDDNTFVLTASTNSPIGRVTRFVSAGVGIVEFDAGKGALGLLAALTDSTTETADATIADVSTVVTGVDGTANNAASKADVDTRLGVINQNFADLTAKYNALATLIE